MLPDDVNSKITIDDSPVVDADLPNEDNINIDNNEDYQYSAYPSNLNSDTNDNEAAMGNETNQNEQTTNDYFTDFQSAAYKGVKETSQQAMIFVNKNGGSNFLIGLGSLIVLVMSINKANGSNEDDEGNETNEGNEGGIGIGFGIFTSLVSLGISGARFYHQKKPTLKESTLLGLTIGSVAIWTINALWLTFDEDLFGVTGNAYFAIWANFFLSVQLLSTETNLLAAVFAQAKAAGFHLGLLFVCSVVLLYAAFIVKTNLGRVIGFVSLALSVLIFLFVEKVSQQITVVIFASLTILWAVGAFVLTMSEPFNKTGNGYFAVWGGTIASGLLLSKVLNLSSGGTILEREAQNGGNVV